MPIHFGTDGWRAVISDTFTFHNLRLVSQAIADALRADAEEGAALTAVVGFDTRFLSDRYAREVARVLAANGIEVWLAQADAPTPAISYAVKHKGAAAGVMITASHNAPRYNGVKLKAAYGGSAPPEQARRVEVYLNDSEERGRGPNLMDYDQARRLGLLERFNPLPAYFAHLHTLIDADRIAEGKLRAVVDSMYGSGRGVIRAFLQGTGVEVHEIRAEMNPGFGGVHPEPIARYLGALATAIATGRGDVGLATDGDADRLGVGDEHGQFVNQLRVYALLAYYLLEVRGQRGPIVKTISTTALLNKLGKRYGVPVYETGVGFKYVAPKMLEVDALIGGEESGGYAFRGNVPERDGILAGLYILDMMVKLNRKPAELVDLIFQEVGPSYYDRIDTPFTGDRHPIEERVRNAKPETIGGLKVTGFRTIDGYQFMLEDGGWLLIRFSGTEPLLRVYCETTEADRVQPILEDGLRIAGLKD